MEPITATDPQLQTLYAGQTEIPLIVLAPSILCPKSKVLLSSQLRPSRLLSPSDTPAIPTVV